MNPIIATMIRGSGRSWWQCRYSTGKILSEWDTLTTKLLLPSSNGKSSRWEDIPKDNMIGLRLLCPNAMAGELEAPEGHKFFQLKVGGFDVAFSPGAKTRRYCDAHIIGVVKDSNGECFCRAWEMKEKRLIKFYDNVFNMQYRNIGTLSTDVQGLKI